MSVVNSSSVGHGNDLGYWMVFERIYMICIQLIICILSLGQLILFMA